VRKLAEKSALAAREIAKLINETVNRVGEGTRLSAKSRTRLPASSSRSPATSASIGEIHASTSAQAGATHDVSALLAELERAATAH
jgi:methyl-accepting chemotaxis protein